MCDHRPERTRCHPVASTHSGPDTQTGATMSAAFLRRCAGYPEVVGPLCDRQPDRGTDGFIDSRPLRLKAEEVSPPRALTVSPMS